MTHASQTQPRPAIHLRHTDLPTDSYLGGQPRAGTPFTWPRKNGRALSFIAQLDLVELNSHATVDWLPTHGRLLIFYDLADMVWGFDPQDRGSWAVLYDDGHHPPVNVTPPKDLDDDLCMPTQVHLAPHPIRSCPSSQRLDSADDAQDALYGDAPRHQIGGYPSPVQGDDMELECQLASHGVYCGSPEGYRSAAARQLQAQPHDWRLLVQFDSDDTVGIMWGDCGRLYFWIEAAAARDHRFDSAWLVLQCG